MINTSHSHGSLDLATEQAALKYLYFIPRSLDPIRRSQASLAKSLAVASPSRSTLSYLTSSVAGGRRAWAPILFRSWSTQLPSAGPEIRSSDESPTYGDKPETTGGTP